MQKNSQWKQVSRLRTAKICINVVTWTNDVSFSRVSERSMLRSTLESNLLGGLSGRSGEACQAMCNISGHLCSLNVSNVICTANDVWGSGCCSLMCCSTRVSVGLRAVIWFGAANRHISSESAANLSLSFSFQSYRSIKDVCNVVVDSFAVHIAVQKGASARLRSQQQFPLSIVLSGSNFSSRSFQRYHWCRFVSLLRCISLFGWRLMWWAYFGF